MRRLSRLRPAVYADVSTRGEFRVRAKAPDTPPAGGSASISTGLGGEGAGHPAVHLSSMKGVARVKALLLCGRGPATGFLFSDSSTRGLQADAPGEARPFLRRSSRRPSVVRLGRGTPHASCT